MATKPTAPLPSGWSLDSFNHHLNEFLKSEQSGVLSIKGKWGTGKTYHWNRSIVSFAQKNKPARNRYAYVSLFGLNSIEELKNSIVLNITSIQDAGKVISLDSLKENSLKRTIGLGTRLPAIASHLAKSIKTPYVDISLPFHAITSLLTRNIFICLDDIERIGKGLSVKELLGCISLLKEQYNCKVIILINSDESGLEDYWKYREKVVDTELTFEPTVPDCISIVLDKNSEWFEIAQSAILKLDIKNIRTIQKIDQKLRSITVELKKLLTNSDNALSTLNINQAYNSIVLFCWAHHEITSSSIPIKFLRAKNGWHQLKTFGDANEETVSKWNTSLINYGYSHTDALDTLLIDYIENGWLNKTGLITIIQGRIKEFDKLKKQNPTDEAWRLFRDNFEDKKDEFIEKIYTSTKDAIASISLSTLIVTYCALRDLNEIKKANELVESFIFSNKNTPELFKSEYATPPPELAERFKSLYRAVEYAKSVKEILIDMDRTRGWGNLDTEKLLRTSAEEYYDLFKSLRGEELHSCIKSALFLGELGNASDEYKKISSNAKEALRKIASECKFNEFRFKTIGYQINP